MTKKLLILIVIIAVAAAAFFLIDGYQSSPASQQQVSEGTSVSDIESDLRMDIETGDADFRQLDAQINQL